MSAIVCWVYVTALVSFIRVLRFSCEFLRWPFERRLHAHQACNIFACGVAYMDIPVADVNVATSTPHNNSVAATKMARISPIFLQEGMVRRAFNTLGSARRGSIGF